MYHDVANQILQKKWLYRQYKNIERTTVPNLTPAGILAYFCGQENREQHAIVIIAIEKDHEVVQNNMDKVVIKNLKYQLESERIRKAF